MPPSGRETPVRGDRKNVLSCSECRRMKWKCDRQFPCSHCRKRGIASLCPEGQLPPVRGIPAIQSSAGLLREQVIALEEELRQVKKQMSIQTRSKQRDSGAEAHSACTMANGAGRGARSESAGSGREREHPEGSMVQDSGQLVLGEEPGTSSFFGNAGAQYLLGNGASRDWRPTARVPSPSGILLPIAFAGLPHSDISMADLVACLPEESTARDWSAIYFENASFMNCIVDREVYFTKHLQDAYRAPTQAPADAEGPIHMPNNQTLALVYLVLAIGAQMNPDLPPYNEASERLYDLARASLSLDASGSTTLIQVLHLTSRYLVNSNNGPRASEGFWTTLGLAVRCAQSLGLHRDGQKWDLTSEEVDFRRRIFWEIHTEDVLQSLTQGRPRVISDATIDCQTPSVSLGPLAASPDLLFHDYKYRLAQLLGLVNDLQTHVTSAPYQLITSIHNRIKSFEQNLPPVLQGVDPAAASDPRCQWQRLILRLLINEGYLFLHRAHFARALRDCPEEPLQSDYRFSYVSELDASRVILSILGGALTLRQSLACRFWIFFFHAFTATVNFAAVAVRSPSSMLAQACMQQVDVGVGLFESVPEGYRARQEIPTLRRLRDKAHGAMRESRPSTDDDHETLLGAGTRLVRLVNPAARQQASVGTKQGGSEPNCADDPLRLSNDLDSWLEMFSGEPWTSDNSREQTNVLAQPNASTTGSTADPGPLAVDFDFDDFFSSLA